MQFLIALLEHPVLLVILAMFFMGFVGMTYEFILRLCGKKPFLEQTLQNLKAEDNNSEPPEPVNVPKPPTGPNDTLEGEAEIEGGEEVEDEDGNVEFHYIYKSDELAPSYWSGLNFTMTKDNKIKEGTH